MTGMTNLVEEAMQHIDLLVEELTWLPGQVLNQGQLFLGSYGKWLLRIRNRFNSGGLKLLDILIINLFTAKSVLYKEQT